MGVAVGRWRARKASVRRLSKKPERPGARSGRGAPVPSCTGLRGSGLRPTNRVTFIGGASLPALCPTFSSKH